MVVAATLRINARDLKRITKTLKDRLPKETNDSLFDFAKLTAERMRKNAILDPLRPQPTRDRQMAAARIVAKRQSRFRSNISVPSSLDHLDSMKPHYVSLKRGRNITAWAKRNYGTTIVSGRSYVRRGPREGIQGGYLYVVPHPFIQKSLQQSRNMLPNELRKGIKRAFRGAA